VCLSKSYFADQIKESEVSGACSTYREEENYILSIGGKPEGKRALRRYRSRWKENSEVDLKVRGWESMD